MSLMSDLWPQSVSQVVRSRVQNQKTKLSNLKCLKSQVCDGIDGEALATGSFPRWGFDRGPRSPVPPGHPGHPPDPPSQDPPSKPPHTPHDPPPTSLTCPAPCAAALLHYIFLQWWWRGLMRSAVIWEGGWWCSAAALPALQIFTTPVQI